MAIKEKLKDKLPSKLTILQPPSFGDQQIKSTGGSAPYKPENTFNFNLIFYVFAVYGLLVILSGNCYWQTLFAAYLEIQISVLGIIAGTHSLWAQQTYRATLPLR